MRLSYIFCALCIHGATAAIVRKPPAFATPIYSDAYLPASMQVIFNIVDQLKRNAAEDDEENQASTPVTSPHPPGQKQPLPTVPTIGATDDVETTTVNDEEKYYIPPERYQEEALIIARPEEAEKIAGSQVTSEVNHEESEVVYGVPETNYELPEPNHEVPEESQLNLSQLGTATETGSGIAQTASPCNEFKPSSELVTSDAATSTVDSVVKEIYSIVKTSSSSNATSSADILPQIKYPGGCSEGKNPPKDMLAEESPEDKERRDELKDDKRFTLLGERVDQVPRPSLAAFLKAGNTTSSPTLRHLGELYDALSKDARKQGFSKYAGYSDKVLKTLEESAGGGAGVQLKELLEKIVEKNELTRFDATSKIKETISILNDDSSELSRDLRYLLPLPFRP